MKCRTCGNEMEIRQTETGKIAICHQCKVKRKLVKKTSQPKPETPPAQTYSNIPDEEVRKKAERDVKDNYSQMLSAGSEPAARPAKSRPAPANKPKASGSTSAPRKGKKRKKKNKARAVMKILIVLIILAALGAGAFFGYRYFTGRTSNNNTDTTESNSGSASVNDSIDVSTDTFAVQYLESQTSTDRDGNPCLLVHYTFTNKQKNMNASALTTVNLVVEQNGTAQQQAILSESREDVQNGLEEIENGHSITVCQVFTLTDTSDVTLKISDLLTSGAPVLGEQIISLQ